MEKNDNNNFSHSFRVKTALTVAKTFAFQNIVGMSKQNTPMLYYLLLNSQLPP